MIQSIKLYENIDTNDPSFNKTDTQFKMYGSILDYFIYPIPDNRNTINYNLLVIKVI
jgi:hypothetical protein